MHDKKYAYELEKFGENGKEYVRFVSRENIRDEFTSSNAVLTQMRSVVMSFTALISAEGEG